MKKLSFYFALAALALFFSSLSIDISGQAAPAHTPPRPVTHKPATPLAGPPLPRNIPPARGIAKSIYALRYIDVKLGTGAAAMPGWIYSVHYTGWLYDGTKFDSSLDRGTPIQFPQGQHRVIIGWDTAFEGMKVGGKRRLLIPWQLAYGEQGHPPVIPAKANLIFDIELVDQRDPNPPPAPAPAAAPPSTAPAPPSPPPSTPETKAPPPHDAEHDATPQPKSD